VRSPDGGLPGGPRGTLQAMKKLLVVAASFGSLLPACLVNYDETTLVRVRDASAVSVEAPTPGGSTRLLDAGGPVGAAYVPRSRPPFTEEVKAATVVRRASGEVTLACPSCLGAPESVVIQQGAPIVLQGNPGQTLVWTPGALGMRFAQDALFGCHRGGGKCPREALSLRLETPAINVLDVRYRKRVATAHGERAGAWIMAATGALSITAAPVIDVATWSGDHHVSAAAIGLSSAFVAVGAFFMTAGLMGVLAKDSETPVVRAE
jgi:hypothetical protein